MFRRKEEFHGYDFHRPSDSVSGNVTRRSRGVSDAAEDIVTTGSTEGDPAPAFQSVANDTASGPVDKTVKSIDTEPEKSAELRTILESLPKDPDPALYAAILADRDRESLIADVKAMIDRRKRIHRPRTALTAFLNWLEGLA